MALFIKSSGNLVSVNPMMKKGGGAISDLSGTTWLLHVDGVIGMGILVHDGGYGSPIDGYTDITFISNNTQFTGMLSYDYSEYELVYNGSDSILVQDLNGWLVSDAYKTITITGGADATNADLIAYLQSNATLVSGGASLQTVGFDYTVPAPLCAVTYSIASDMEGGTMAYFEYDGLKYGRYRSSIGGDDKYYNAGVEVTPEDMPFTGTIYCPVGTVINWTDPDGTTFTQYGDVVVTRDMWDREPHTITVNGDGGFTLFGED